AEMNLGLAVSAESTRLPSLRATSLSGGSCSLRFTMADCAPAVERPSSQGEASMMRRKSATSSLLSTSGTQISTSELRRGDDVERPPRRDRDEQRRAAIERVVIELVGQVLRVELHGPVLVDLLLDERVEAPVARKFGAGVGGEGAAIDLRAVDRLPAKLPAAVELVLAQHAEGFMGDVGHLQPDVARDGRLRDLRPHQHQTAENAPAVGDLAADLEVDTLDLVGRPRLQRVRAVHVHRFARIVLLGVEQRARHQEATIEQLPLGADLGSLVALGSKDYAARDSATVIRGCTVEFGTERVGRGRVGRIEASDRHRLEDNAAVVVD